MTVLFEIMPPLLTILPTTPILLLTRLFCGDNVVPTPWRIAVWFLATTVAFTVLLLLLRLLLLQLFCVTTDCGDGLDVSGDLTVRSLRSDQFYGKRQNNIDYKNKQKMTTKTTTT